MNPWTMTFIDNVTLNCSVIFTTALQQRYVLQRRAAIPNHADISLRYLHSRNKRDTGRQLDAASISLCSRRRNHNVITAFQYCL